MAETLPTVDRLGITGPVVVVSPHLDDAVLSVGATLSMLSRRGIRATIVTVLAYDPSLEELSKAWDLQCGFKTASAAVQARRAEDARACAVLGVDPVWLPFSDDEHTATSTRQEVVETVRAAVSFASTVLTPGFPLSNPDHAWVTELLFEALRDEQRLGLYLEQPYASDHLAVRSIDPSRRTLTRCAMSAFRLAVAGPESSGRRPSLPLQLQDLVWEPVQWAPLATTWSDWVKKERAIGAYRSQLRALRPLVRSRIGLFELGGRGEALAWTRHVPTPTIRGAP